MIAGTMKPARLIHWAISQSPTVTSTAKTNLNKCAIATKLKTMIASLDPVFMMTSSIAEENSVFALPLNMINFQAVDVQQGRISVVEKKAGRVPPSLI